MSNRDLVWNHSVHNIITPQNDPIMASVEPALTLGASVSADIAPAIIAAAGTNTDELMLTATKLEPPRKMATPNTDNAMGPGPRLDSVMATSHALTDAERRSDPTDATHGRSHQAGGTGWESSPG